MRSPSPHLTAPAVCKDTDTQAGKPLHLTLEAAGANTDFFENNWQGALAVCSHKSLAFLCVLLIQEIFTEDFLKAKCCSGTLGLNQEPHFPAASLWTVRWVRKKFVNLCPFCVV